MNLFGIIGLKDIVDILLVAGLMFYIYKLMKDTGTLNIFIGFLSFIIVWFLLAKVFDMQLIGAIMDKFTDAALFVIVVLFQDQIKRFFNEVGSHQRWRFLNKFLHKAENKDKQKWVMPVVYACMSMSKSKTGALIVIQQHMSLDDYARTGDVIDARVHPTFIPDDHPLASVNGSFNAIFLHGHACDDMMLFGRGAGSAPTASAVVADMLYAVSRDTPRHPTFRNTNELAEGLTVTDDWHCSFYVRLTASDRPGVLARITACLGDEGISIRNLMQRDAVDGHAQIVLITHDAGECAIRKALAAIASDDVQVESMIRVER